ncbi:3-oxoacyl-(acyl-carrier-protein) reductase FabG [Sporotomaculum syntrophicum]|uniref:3-oxoacyl-[acyl-carrier-protein] reductase n=1 Tax=Sporotomaculum syntrophicum TaxID=182264 RepID=A0A9D2WTC4_9FIRM|nr:3-oxoacyl-[acyl-carrier-protein] reductase [Sporotomaculum syntrophicum]KAF1086733.1 3-oxoacyl-(acyl-carrier-protein) reductase FabG [Sporotomaculum syntrophicum]
MDLGGKVAVVTGASRGIGRAVAVTLAGLGAHIIVNYAGHVEGAKETSMLVRDLGVRALIHQADVANQEQVDTMMQQALQEFGRIDILVNNAGITRDNLLPRMREQDWDAVLDINLKGAYHCTKAALRPMLKARWGRIINISSVVGLSGNAGQSNYAAAKAGLIGFTKALAKEFGTRNITVNAVAPGYISTDMTADFSEENKTQLLSGVPLGRLGTTEDVATAVAFLASEWAGYITGQVIVVDGGMSM